MHKLDRSGLVHSLWNVRITQFCSQAEQDYELYKLTEPDETDLLSKMISQPTENDVYIFSLNVLLPISLSFKITHDMRRTFSQWIRNSLLGFLATFWEACHYEQWSDFGSS